MSDYIFKAGNVTVSLNNVYGVCTKCNVIKPIAELGLRNLDKGKVTNQPQCIKCRGGK